MAKTARSTGFPPELAVAALVGAAAIPLARLFKPGAYGGVAVLTIVVALGVSWAHRRWRWPVGLAWAISLIALVWFLAMRFFPSTLFGVFPSPGTIRAIWTAMHDGAKQIYDETTPVVPTTALMMYVSAGIWATVWLVDTAAMWIGNPLLAIASAVPLFVIAGALVPSQRLWFDAALFLGAAALIMFFDERSRDKRLAIGDAVARAGWRPRSAITLALAGVILATLAGQSLPGFGRSPTLKDYGPGARIGFNPLVAIRPTLDNAPVLTMFRVSTAHPAYYRLTTLENFDGKTWSQRQPRTTTRLSTPEIAPAFLGDTESVTQQFTILALAGPWLPAAFEPRAVFGVDGVSVEDDSRALLTPHGASSVERYEVRSAVPDITSAALDTPVSYGEPVFAPYLKLPKIPAAVRAIADQWAGKEPNAYRRAIAIQQHLRTFTYDQNVAAGHSFKTMEEFLTKVKRGYCEQFAATMAVMARMLGIPARVAIGFGTGSLEGAEYRVTTKDAHAWPELFFPQAGWLAFEPTPRAGFARVPAYSIPPSGSVTDPNLTPSAAASASPGAPKPLPKPSAENPAQSKARGIPAWIIAALGALALLLASGAWLFFARRHRPRSTQDARMMVRSRYVEFLAWCDFAGFGRAPGETPREHATRITTPPSAVPLGRLAVLVDHALYAPANGLDPADADGAAEQARAALSEGLSRRRRAGARIGAVLTRGRR